MKDKNINIHAIRKQAEQLFTLIEEAVNASHEDTVAETMADEMGKFIKSSKGFDILNYAFLISQTQREQAVLGFEESLHNMREEALDSLNELTEGILWAREEIQKDDPDIHTIMFSLRRAETPARKLMKLIKWEYKGRARVYRAELERVDPS